MDSTPDLSAAAASSAPEPGCSAPAVPSPVPGPEAPGAGAGIPPLPVNEPFRFHGEAREYFRIWIVNTLLTLLTLGVFFAWAKVRKRRYLRGCCELMGHRFDYRADPRRILVGNLIAVMFFLAYSVFGAVYPAVQFGTIGVGLLLLPWIVARSFSFNAHNTVYRGIRFRFHGSLGAATWTFLLLPLAIILSLGAYYPAWARARQEYVVTNHRLGDAYFRFTARTKPYYLAYLTAAGVLVVSALLTGFIIAGLTARLGGPVPQAAMVGVTLVVYGGGLFVSRQLVHAWLFNHVWNHTFLDEHRFEARMQTSRWLGLQVTNLLAIVASAGLLAPWATIRSHRYTASCLSFVPAGPVERIERMGGASGSATGDSAAEVIGLDFGF